VVWDTKKEMKTMDEIIKEIVEEEYKKIVKPKVLIEQKAHDKSKLLCEEYPDLEWMAGMVGNVKVIDGVKHFNVEDIVVVEQEVAGATVKATDKGNKQLSEIKNLLGWIHSHNNMDSFQSSTDVDTAYNYQLTITTNNKSHYTGQCVLKINILGNEKEVIIPVDISIEITNEYDEFIKQAKELISEEKHSVDYSKYYEGDYAKYYKPQGVVLREPHFEKESDYEEEDYEDNCVICGNKVSERKAVMCVFCGNIMHKKCYNRKYDYDKEGCVCPNCRKNVFVHDGFDEQSRIVDDYL
jgi:hypothetical protein